MEHVKEGPVRAMDGLCIPFTPSFDFLRRPIQG